MKGKVLQVTLLVMLFTTSISHAYALWDQTTAASTSDYWVSGTAPTDDFHLLVADDFQISRNSAVNNITLLTFVNEWEPPEYNLTMNIYQDSSGLPFPGGSDLHSVNPVWTWSGVIDANPVVSIDTTGLQLTTGRYWLMAYQPDDIYGFLWYSIDSNNLNNAMTYDTWGAFYAANTWEPLTDPSVWGSSPAPSHLDLAFKIEGTPSPVPLPSTLLLMGSGLAGLIGYGRTRTKR